MKLGSPRVGWLGQFSAGFYAGLLRDLGATLVIALDPVDYDPRALEDAGLRVCTLEDLPSITLGRQRRCTTTETQGTRGRSHRVGYVTAISMPSCRWTFGPAAERHGWTSRRLSRYPTAPNGAKLPQRDVRA